MIINVQYIEEIKLYEDEKKTIAEFTDLLHHIKVVTNNGSVYKAIEAIEDAIEEFYECVPDARPVIEED